MCMNVDTYARIKRLGWVQTKGKILRRQFEQQSAMIKTFQQLSKYVSFENLK